MADQGPGGGQAEHAVDQGGDEGRSEGQTVGGEGPSGEGGLQEIGEALRRGLQDDRQHRDEHDGRQEGDRDAQAEREPRNRRPSTEERSARDGGRRRQGLVGHVALGASRSTQGTPRHRLCFICDAGTAFR